MEFLMPDPAQPMIGNFAESRLGQPLFVPDAGKGLP
jgi:hypothetical protein